MSRLPADMHCPWYPYASAVINFGVATDYHRDCTDFHVCTTVAFGDYTGGDQMFYELGLVAAMRSGNMSTFLSQFITHGNRHMEGTRVSIAMSIDKHFKRWNLDQFGHKNIVP